MKIIVFRSLFPKLTYFNFVKRQKGVELIIQVENFDIDSSHFQTAIATTTSTTNCLSFFKDVFFVLRKHFHKSIRCSGTLVVSSRKNLKDKKRERFQYCYEWYGTKADAINYAFKEWRTTFRENWKQWSWWHMEKRGLLLIKIFRIRVGYRGWFREFIDLEINNHQLKILIMKIALRLQSYDWTWPQSKSQPS